MSRLVRARLIALLEWLGVALLFAVLVAIVTWPQAAQWRTHAPGHHDVLFNMWRLSWIAESLATAPLTLFNPPIFYPASRVLAFSDAVLLQGLVAMPFLRAGFRVLPVHNIVLLMGPWLSCLGTYLLVRSLLTHLSNEGGPPPGGADRVGISPRAFMWPALVAGAIFGLLPFRVEHIMHLELQWSQWMPLACWALHRAVWHGRIRDGVLTATFVMAQFLSCIYYGVFLVLVLTISAPLLLWTRNRAPLGRIARALVVGALVWCGPLVAYSAPYRTNQKEFGGGRAGWEIDVWSATPKSFLAVPPENRLYGALTSTLAGSESRLMPGLLAALLAIAGAWWTRRRIETRMYVAALIASAVLALGTNTVLYRLLLAVVSPLQGLRVPARFGMVMALAIAVLAGLGAARLLARVRRPLLRHALGGALVGVCVLEYASDVGPLERWVQRAPVYALWLRGQPPAAVLELPAPRSWALPLYDAEWSYLGRFHGQPMVNGYSGYYPREYLDLLNTLVRFPNAASLDALRRHGVRYIVLHEDRYFQRDFLEFDTQLRATPGLTFAGRFPDFRYPVTIFVLD